MLHQGWELASLRFFVRNDESPVQKNPHFQRVPFVLVGWLVGWLVDWLPATCHVHLSTVHWNSKFFTFFEGAGDHQNDPYLNHHATSWKISH